MSPFQWGRKVGTKKVQLFSVLSPPIQTFSVEEGDGGNAEMVAAFPFSIALDISVSDFSQLNTFIPWKLNSF